MAVYLGDKRVGLYLGGATVVDDKWEPNPLWWDIKTILANDTDTAPSKFINLLYNINDTTTFVLNTNFFQKIVTSDGATYTLAEHGSSVIHTWDKSKDKPISNNPDEKIATRYFIGYSNKTTPLNYSSGNSLDFIPNDSSIYTIFDLDLTQTGTLSGNRYLQNCPYLQCIEFTEGKGIKNATTLSNLFNACPSLCKVVDSIDCTNVVDTSALCNNNYNLLKAPKLENTTKLTRLQNTFNGCYKIKSLSAMDTSKVTVFSNFLAGCFALEKIDGELDFSSAVNLSNCFSNCTNLKSIANCKNFTNSITNSSYFCSNCTSLEDVGDMYLDTSNSTNCSYMFANCRKLKKLPAGIDTSKSTIMTNFLYQCFALEDLNGAKIVIASTIGNLSSTLTALISLPQDYNGTIDIDTSGITNYSYFTGFFTYITQLTSLPFVLDISNIPSGTARPQPLISSFSLVDVKIKLGYSPFSPGTISNNLSVESMQYMADNSPQLTTTRALALGASNIARAGGSSSPIIQQLVSKGWTVS